MLGEIFGRGGCGCRRPMPQLKSCDVLWIIILLLVVFNGGLFGLDICTLVILAVVFGSQFLCRDRHRCEPKC